LTDTAITESSQARKPFKGTVAENVLKWGTGGIDIDGSRVKSGPDHIKNATRHTNKIYRGGFNDSPINSDASPLGRFPANLVHDGSDEVLEVFPNTKSGKMGANNTRHTDGSPNGIYGKFDVNHPLGETYGDSGSASRFFYCAKASKSERNKGCEEMEDKERIDYGGFHSEKGLIENNRNPENRLPMKNNHPTVKPIALMEYLVKLVTKQNAVVLDPFAGSGSTLIACKNLNRNYIGIERELEYIEIINKRLCV